MRARTFVFCLLVACAALALWLMRRDANTTDTPTKPGAAERPITNAEVDHETLAKSDPIGEGRASGIRAELQSPPRSDFSMQPSGFFRVLGRVIDEHGAPVAGATAHLHAIARPLVPIVDMSMIDTDGRAHDELSTTTRADGTFTISARLPRSEWVDLEVEPSIFMTRAVRHFGPGVESDFRRLSSGDNDLGDISVCACGAARGRVVTDKGTPLPAAHVVVEKGDEIARSSFAVTDAHGRFVLGHLNAGKGNLAVTVDGHFMRGSLEAEIRNGATTDIDDIQVTTSSALMGSVVDASGAGIAGVLLRGVKENGGASAAVTRADGSFSMWFDFPGRSSIEVIAPQYDAWEHDASTRYETGATDVRIVLTCRGRMSFRVIDAHTRRPIERFGIAIDHETKWFHDSTADDRALPLEDHPGGEAVRSVPHGVAYVVVRALGHAPLEASIEDGAANDLHQTLALMRASSLRGRVTSSGVPVPAAMLMLMPDAVAAPAPSKAPSGDTTAAAELRGFAARLHVAHADADGSFELVDLAAGTYLLQIDARGTAKITVRGLVVPPEGVLDLGDVALATNAMVRGIVTTVPGESPRGFVVTLDAKHEASRAISDAAGLFEIQGISAGTHTLTWNRPSENTWPRADDPREQRIELASGETRQVAIDASKSAPSRLVVRVVNAGVPMSGVIVRTKFLAGSIHSPGTVLMLGATDSAGHVEGAVDGDARFELLAETNEGLSLGSLGEIMTATPGAVVERTFVVRAGRLLIDAPPGLQRPDDGLIEIETWRSDAGSKTFRAYAPGAPLRPAVFHKWQSGTIDFGSFPPGEMTITVSFQRIVIDESEQEGVHYERLIEPYSKVVTIVDGQEAHVAAP
jgi:hypothetical protein